MTDQISTVDIEKIATEGEKIYESKKLEFEPHLNGKFLAIDTDSKDVYLADDGAKAVESALKAHPNKVFFVVKIGFETAESIARSFNMIT